MGFRFDDQWFQMHIDLSERMNQRQEREESSEPTMAQTDSAGAPSRSTRFAAVGALLQHAWRLIRSRGRRVSHAELMHIDGREPTSHSSLCVLIGTFVVAGSFVAGGAGVDTWPLRESRALAAQEALVGVNMHPLQDSYAPVSPEWALALAAGIGASIVRIDIYWSDIETAGPGTSGWDDSRIQRLDAFLTEARRRHIQVLATVLGTPCWASADPNGDCNGNLPPSRPQDFSAFLSPLIQHVGDEIKYYEFWNEPNIPRFWAHPNAIAYAALLKSAYVAVKTINPSLEVLAGATSYADLAFINAMYGAGAKGNFDALSIHPYTDGGMPDRCSVPSHSFACGIRSVAATMRKHGDTPSIWLTELGIPVGDTTNEREQATYLTQACRDIQSWSYVHGALWYQLFDGPGTFETGFGLFRSDLSPRPAAQKFALEAQTA